MLSIIIIKYGTLYEFSIIELSIRPHKWVVFIIMWEGHVHMPAVAVIDTFSSIAVLQRLSVANQTQFLRSSSPFYRLCVFANTRKIDFHAITRLLIAPRSILCLSVSNHHYGQVDFLEIFVCLRSIPMIVFL